MNLARIATASLLILAAISARAQPDLLVLYGTNSHQAVKMIHGCKSFGGYMFCTGHHAEIFRDGKACRISALARELTFAKTGPHSWRYHNEGILFADEYDLERSGGASVTGAVRTAAEFLKDISTQAILPTWRKPDTGEPVYNDLDAWREVGKVIFGEKVQKETKPDRVTALGPDLPSLRMPVLGQSIHKPGPTLLDEQLRLGRLPGPIQPPSTMYLRPPEFLRPVPIAEGAERVMTHHGSGIPLS